MQLGDPERALPLHARALAVWEAACGADHPEVAHALTDIAVIHLEQVTGGRRGEVCLVGVRGSA